MSTFIYFRNTHIFAALTREIFFPLEDKLYIFAPPLIFSIYFRKQSQENMRADWLKIVLLGLDENTELARELLR